eukprot:132863_1
MAHNLVLMSSLICHLAIVISSIDYLTCTWFGNRTNAPIYPIDVCTTHSHQTESNTLSLYSTKLECNGNGEVIQFEWNNTECSGNYTYNVTYHKEHGYYFNCDALTSCPFTKVILRELFTHNGSHDPHICSFYMNAYHEVAVITNICIDLIEEYNTSFYVDCDGMSVSYTEYIDTTCSTTTNATNHFVITEGCDDAFGIGMNATSMMQNAMMLTTFHGAFIEFAECDDANYDPSLDIAYKIERIEGDYSRYSAGCIPYATIRVVDGKQIEVDWVTNARPTAFGLYYPRTFRTDYGHGFVNFTDDRTHHLFYDVANETIYWDSLSSTNIWVKVDRFSISFPIPQDGEVIECDEYCGCNDLTITLDHTVLPFVYLRCLGNNSCSNITINVDDDVDLDIICQGINACSYLTIKGEYIYESISLIVHCVKGAHSYNNSVCDNLYIDIENAQSIDIICHDYGCSNIVVFALDVTMVRVLSYGRLALVNATVYAANSNLLNVTCSSVSHISQDPTCQNLNLHLSSMLNNLTIFHGTFHLHCVDGTHSHNNSVCDHLYIEIENANLTNIECDSFGCNDIVVVALDANMVSVVANERLALVNSTVHASESSQLDVACVSMLHNGQTCFNLSLYLSSMANGNTLKCQFGCERINLHFLNEINMSLFNAITFTECAVCQTISDCMDKWMISYHYNDVEYSVFYYGNVTANSDDELLEFSSYVNDKNECPNTLQSNSIMYGISFVMFIVCSLMIFTLLVCLFKHLYIECYNKYNHIFVWSAKRPSILVLFYSVLNKIIVFIVMLWWAMKISVFNVVVSEYCDLKYNAVDPQYCGNDDICYYDSDVEHCFQMTGYVFCVFVWLVLVVAMGWEMWYIFHASCVEYERSIEQYHKRQFWIIKKETYICKCWDLDFCYFPCCCCCDLKVLIGVSIWSYIGVQCICFGIVTLMVGIFVSVVGHYDSDYVIKPYELYSVLALIVSRILLELWYTYGRTYDPTHESSKRIHHVLNAKFGSHISYIIKMYLPLYRDEVLCSSDMIISSEDVEKFKHQKSIELSFFEE